MVQWMIWTIQWRIRMQLVISYCSTKFSKTWKECEWNTIRLQDRPHLKQRNTSELVWWEETLMVNIVIRSYVSLVEDRRWYKLDTRLTESRLEKMEAGTRWTQGLQNQDWKRWKLCHILTFISFVLYLFSMVRAWVGWTVYVCFSMIWVFLCFGLVWFSIRGRCH